MQRLISDLLIFIEEPIISSVTVSQNLNQLEIMLLLVNINIPR